VKRLVPSFRDGLNRPALTTFSPQHNLNDDDAINQSKSATRSPFLEQNGNAFASGPATRRMRSNDNLPNDRWDESHEGGGLLPAFSPEPNSGRNATQTPASRTQHRRGDEGGKLDDHVWAYDPATEDSKWIHRDKLAKIESEELQAAGIFVPRSRAPSKQKRDRSRSTMRRGTDASDPNHAQSRSRKNSTAVEQRTAEISVPSWDLRTPEEIAEEEANAYFTNNGLKGASRIPVAKASPAPITLDWMDRGSRKNSESPEEEPNAIGKTRSRSASASWQGPDKPNMPGILGPAKRSATDISPKKNATGNRKASSGAKAVGNAAARPKTRSGSSGGATRPSTRSGESPPNKQPEGDPPWINTYQPDPRLPPDQQLLPTVAKRLQQEKWEKDGTPGDIYDTDFRPLNDNSWKAPPSPEKGQNADGNQQLLGGEWPLKPETAPKSPNLRQGSYSTMPKIQDKSPTSPVASPRLPAPNAQTLPTQPPQAEEGHQQVPDEKGDEKKEQGCGCCLVM
jgi:hypothetical protein